MQQLRNFKAALEIYETIYDHRGVLKEIDYNMGLCYYHLNELDSAVEYLKKYMFAIPSHHSIYFHLVKVLKARGKIYSRYAWGYRRYL